MKKLFTEFKEFISRGNVIDLAVGIIIGGAFTSIVNSMVNDVFMPFIGLITNNALVPKDKAAPVFNPTAFISALINFFIVALIVFFVVKAFNQLSNLNKLKDILHKEEIEAETAPVTEKECPFCKTTISIDAVRCPHCTSHLNEEIQPTKE